MRRFKKIVALTCLAAGLTLMSESVSAQDVAKPPAPAEAPAAVSPVMTGIVDLATADSPLGLGHVAPQRGTEASWLAATELPLFSTPNGDHWGWLWRGWLIPNGQGAYAIGRDASFAMVGVDSSRLGFPVLAARDDGWLQIQYTTEGSAWVHQTHLRQGTGDLRFVSWEDSLAAAATVEMRHGDDSQVLRSQPERGRNVLSLISASSLIEPLEMQNGWMRVRVTPLASDCRALAGATQEEGWLRWKDSEGELLLVPGRTACAD